MGQAPLADEQPRAHLDPRVAVWQRRSGFREAVRSAGRTDRPVVETSPTRRPAGMVPLKGADAGGMPPGEGTRVLQFPSDRTLGMLYARALGAAPQGEQADYGV